MMKEVKLLLHDGLLLLDKVRQADFETGDKLFPLLEGVLRGLRFSAVEQCPQAGISARTNRLDLSEGQPNSTQHLSEFDNSLEVLTRNLKLIPIGSIDGDAEVGGARTQEIVRTSTAEAEVLGQFGDGGVIGWAVLIL
ncbi:hypothetical protein [Deinococcus soli (ex Cha et al. 2016)]|uniref:hypothetical protein n=1 Tax=Deinococcus soli (ex Cha et al. 2016) TaxID=1309411 RepID=UPI00166F5465|nr:hypothetical protein [Deinococcus soli (ex Cha et al. 2016)]